MSVEVVAAGCIVAAAVVAAVPANGVRRRLRFMVSSSARRRLRSRQPSRILVAALSGMAVALFLDGWFGAGCGIASGLVLHQVLRRVTPAGVRAARRRAAEDLPLAADLLAAALRAGAAVDRAAGAVGEAIGGPLGERLCRVSRAVRLGAGPEEAWRHVMDVRGADRLARAAIRSAASGGALATALVRLGDDLRAARIADVDAAGRRAGVLVVLPLGLCFLPAFVLAGLVPVIVAVLGDVW